MSNPLWNAEVAARDEAADLATAAENFGIDELVKEVDRLKAELERKNQLLIALQAEVQQLRIYEHNHFIRGVEAERLRRHHNDAPITLKPEIKDGPTTC